jgi:AraC-like DNA-binding protein/quercetin dioxygenase-like cupin family protein
MWRERTTMTAARPRYLGEMVRSRSGESHDWHCHDFGQLILAALGSMQAGTARHVLLLSPAMVLWIPPDARHWMRTSRGNEMLYVDVNREEAAALGLECRVMAVSPLLAAAMRATLPEASRARDPQHTATLHDLLRAELCAARDVPLSIILPEDRRIRAMAERALDDPAAIGSLDDWLEGAAASRKTVERLFIAETGMAPSRWLRQARALKAVTELAAGEKVVSVALNAGYASPSAFGHMFRQTLGLSPSRFARNREAGVWSP